MNIFSKVLIVATVLAPLVLLGSIGMLGVGISIQQSNRLNPPNEIGTNAGTLKEDCTGSAVKPYLAFIHDASAQFNVQAPLIAAVIEAESVGKVSAVSDVGAEGLMQVMPETWREIRRGKVIPNVKEPKVTVTATKNRAGKDLPDSQTDPEAAIYGGTFYLRQNLNQFGDIRYAVAAYNAGPGAVEKYHGVPPYSETQNYVAKIMDPPSDLLARYQKCLEKTPEVNATGGKIYLHWTAGGYGAAHKNLYTYSILDGGKEKHGGGRAHTYARNTDSIGISVAAMANGTQACYKDLRGSGCPTPIQQAQLDRLVDVAARLAVENGIPVDKTHVMTHGEAASLTDYPQDKVVAATKKCGVPATEKDESKEPCYKASGLPHSNYGPYNGGNSMRWEFLGFEDELRSLIAKRAGELRTSGAGGRKASGSLRAPASLGDTHLGTDGASTYQPNRSSHPHEGIDLLPNRKGDVDIIAAAPGKVVAVSSNCPEGNKSCGNDFGNYVYVEHMDKNNQKYYSVYAHLKQGSPLVKVGQSIQAGQKLGMMGNTGRSDQRHLHFALFTNASAHMLSETEAATFSINPCLYLGVGGCNTSPRHGNSVKNEPQL